MTDTAVVIPAETLVLCSALMAALSRNRCRMSAARIKKKGVALVLEKHTLDHMETPETGVWCGSGTRINQTST
jgi:hypothetical protein